MRAHCSPLQICLYLPFCTFMDKIYRTNALLPVWRRLPDRSLHYSSSTIEWRIALNNSACIIVFDQGGADESSLCSTSDEISSPVPVKLGHCSIINYHYIDNTQAINLPKHSPRSLNFAVLQLQFWEMSLFHNNMISESELSPLCTKRCKLPDQDEEVYSPGSLGGSIQAGWVHCTGCGQGQPASTTSLSVDMALTDKLLATVVLAWCFRSSS